MPIKSLTPGNPAPEGSHLAVLAHGGTVKAFPVGTTFVFVGDAADQETWIPMVLIKATLKKWSFRCACGKTKCSRMYHYGVNMTGTHPYDGK